MQTTSPHSTYVPSPQHSPHSPPFPRSSPAQPSSGILQAQLASSLYHLSATHRPGVVPQDAFSPSSAPTSSMHRQPPWTSPVLEPPAYGWPSTPSASASVSTSSSSSGTSPEYNEDDEDEMMLDSPIPSGPNALFPPPAGRNSAGMRGGSGGRPCTPVLPATVSTTTAIPDISLVQPNSMSHPLFHHYHSGVHPRNETSDPAYDPTANSFATSDPFYIDLQQQQRQQQQQQRSRTLQAIPLSFKAQGQAPGYSVQYAPLLRQDHTPTRGAPNLNPSSSSSSSPFSSSSASNPFALRPRY